MSKLTKHERKDKVKWIFTTIALVLAFVLIIGICMQMLMPEGKRPTDWFDKPEQEQTTSGNAIITSDTEASKGIKLMTANISPEDYAEYGISTLAESAFTLTATVTGDSDAAVTYSAAWKNPSSEWATGKNVSDYVPISQGSVGSQTATVSVLQAFSEQVIITCVVTDYPEFSATCTVDYVVTFDVTSNTTLADLNSKFSLSITDIEGTLSCETAGVVDIDVSIPMKLQSDLTMYNPKGSYELSYNLNDLELSLDTSKEYYSVLELFDIYYEECVSGITREEFYNALKKASQSTGPLSVLNSSVAFEPFIFDVTIDRVYNGESYGKITGNFTYTVIDISDFPTYASGIELDKDSIIVG